MNTTYGRLTFSGEIKREGRKQYFKVTCNCGWEGWKRKDHLESGKSQSCGCLRIEATITRFTAHGCATNGIRTTEYSTRQSMLARCNNPKHVFYKNYGARGIKVCERWETSFEHFLEDMGPKPPGTTIDRIDNEKGYEKDNCRWATRKEQAANRRVKELK